MVIYFENSKLRDLANDEKKATQKLGKLRAKTFFKRLESLYFAKTPAELKVLPGNFHELKHSRRKLEDAYSVQILEIIDYH